jgi:hypothetical protein
MAEYQHNCVKTAALSGVVGFGMGGLMGLFMSSVCFILRVCVGLEDCC